MARTQRRPYDGYDEAPRARGGVGYGDPGRYRRRRRERAMFERPSDLGMALVCVLAIGFMGLCAWLGMTLTQPAAKEQAEVPAKKVVHDSMCATHTYGGETIRWYVMVDPDYRVQYLVNDRGGCCVRLDGEGNVMGITGKDKKDAETYDYYEDEEGGYE